MTATQESQYASAVNSLLNLLFALCNSGGLSEKIVLERLLQQRGYKMPRLIRRNKQKVTINKHLIKQLEEKEIEISEQFKEGRRVLSMDKNKARYIIETALMNFKCIMEGRTLKKKDIDNILGYCDRTMRNQQVMYRDKVLCLDTKEHNVYTKLCSEIASYSTE